MVQAVAPDIDVADAVSVCARVERVAAELEGLVRHLDADGWGPSEALRLLAGFVRAAKAATAGQTVAAGRVDATNAARTTGHRTTAELVAARAGTSTAQAHVVVETARSLAERPATADALRAGRVSLEQAHAVAVAANTVPTAETELLALAGSTGLAGLRRRARDVKLAAEMNAPGYYHRMVQSRSLRHWTDPSGMTAGSFRLPPDVGAAVCSVLEAQADRHYRATSRPERHDGRHDQWVADALVTLTTGRTPHEIHDDPAGIAPSPEAPSEATGKKQARPVPEVVVHVSLDALRRGTTTDDEYCLVQGVGPVPVTRARELLADAFVKAVLVDGTDITKVVHYGRRIPAHLRTALVARSIVRYGEVVCSEDGCDTTHSLEWDHVHPVYQGGPTTLDNIKPRCAPDHRTKTLRDLHQPRAGPDP